MNVVHHGEAGLPLLVAGKAVVETIGAHHPLRLAQGHNVNTLPGLECELPVVIGNAGDDMVVGERPLLADTGVFDPYVLVGLGQRDPGLGILHEHGGMGLA